MMTKSRITTTRHWFSLESPIIANYGVAESRPYSTNNFMRTCTFCDEPLSGVASNEHIFPQWLLAELGIQLSPRYVALIASPSTYRLLCFYCGCFFLNPGALVDPEMEEFGKNRIIRLLQSAGANDEKLKATEHFLDTLEDYDSAIHPTSKLMRQLQQSTQHPRDDVSPG